MATYTATGRSIHKTLTAGAEDVVTLDKPYRAVEIINSDSSSAIYVTLAFGTSDPTVTVGVDGSYFVGPGASRVITDDNLQFASSATKVHLISSGACAYHVTGLDT